MTNESQALVPVETRAVASVFGTDSPVEIVQRTQAIAAALGDAIKRGNMSTRIQGREYVLAEGWAYLGSMLGVFPRTVRVEAIGATEDGDAQGYEAHIELVTRDGSVVGGAIAECSRIETSWSDRPPYALKSMAQTRATGKAYRMAFGYVMKAAGYEATPAEEMPSEGMNRTADVAINGPGRPRDVEAQRMTTTSGEVENLGQFLTKCLRELKLNGPAVCKLHDCASTADLASVMEPFETWDAMFDATKAMHELAVPA